MRTDDDARADDLTQVADADLVLRTRSGDTDAFAELWTRHYRSGITAARSMTSSIDADDLVQEAYAKIFQTVKRGGGPTGSFRAYLFTAIRNTAASWGRARSDITIDDIDLADPESTDQAAEDALDRGLTHRAFRSLPTRWQEILWYTEIEQMKPREIAPLVGMTSAAVSQLALRAREGLREAWIQAHIASVDDGSDHQWTIERLAAHTRGNLGSRDRKKVDRHLADCARCAIVAAEAKDVGSRLAMILLPLAVGVPAAGAYLASLQRGEDALIALAAMPPEVVEGAAYAGGAVVAGGAAALTGAGTSGSGSAGGTGATGVAWTVGGIVTAGVATVAVAGAVLAATFSSTSSNPAAAADAFDNAPLPDSAQVAASDELAQATQTEEPDDETDAPEAPAPLGISGARVVDADAGTVSIGVTGEPGSGVSFASGASGGASGGGAVPAQRVPGPASVGTTIGSDGSATLTITLTEAQIRSDATLTIAYDGDASGSVSASLSRLGVLEELFAALDDDAPRIADEPEATPTPRPSPSPTPTPSPTPPIPAPVPAPIEVRAEVVADETVALEWKAPAEDIASYTVWRGTQEDARDAEVVESGVIDVSYTDVVEAGNYVYFVSAIDARGAESPLSAPAHVEVPAPVTTEPAPPEGESTPDEEPTPEPAPEDPEEPVATPAPDEPSDEPEAGESPAPVLPEGTPKVTSVVEQADIFFDEHILTFTGEPGAHVRVTYSGILGGIASNHDETIQLDENGEGTVTVSVGEFSHDHVIEYRYVVLDDNGDPILDENGDPIEGEYGEYFPADRPHTEE